MTDYHLLIEDGKQRNYVICTSALSPDEFEEYVTNSLFTTDSKTVVHVKYLDLEGNWQTFDVNLTLCK